MRPLPTACPPVYWSGRQPLLDAASFGWALPSVANGADDIEPADLDLPAKIGRPLTSRYLPLL